MFEVVQKKAKRQREAGMWYCYKKKEGDILNITEEDS